MKTYRKKYRILLTVASVLAAALVPVEILAQTAPPSGHFPDTKITCNTPTALGQDIDLGSIADPASVSVPIQSVPVGFDCMSSQFYQNSPGEWQATGAVCLAIDTPTGSAAMRKLTHKTDSSAPQLNFNFAYGGSLSPADAIGNADGSNGVGVSTMLASAGANATDNGPALAVGGSSNNLAVYVHNSGQPANLPSGEYEGTFTWKLYAGTSTFVLGPPSRENCATIVGQGPVMQGTIKVKVQVNVSCSLKLPQPSDAIDFGKVTTNELVAGFGPITRHLEIKCNNNNDMFVTIGAGLHSGGNINNRQMKLDGGAALIKYSLTKPGGGEWGDSPTTGSGHRVTGSLGATQTVPIEARILPHSVTVPTGFYRDTVHVQLWN